MSETEELKPELDNCPLCDSRAVYMTFGAIFYGVECSNEAKCGLRLYSMVRSYSEAADIWNRRAPTPSTAALIDAAKAAIKYDDEIRKCGNDPDLMSSFCTTEGDTLDTLYLDWQYKCRVALSQCEAEKEAGR